MGAPPVHRRETVRLLLACDNACTFCSQEGLADHPAPVEAQLTSARSRSDELTFVGGEPTLDEKLADHIALARALGFRRIGLQTNGRKLADGAYTAALARAGLTDVHLSIHGAEPAVHDYHTGVPGSFAACLAGLAATRAEGLDVVVATVLTRSNFRALGALPRLLAARGAAAWLLTTPCSAGRAQTAFDRVIPRLALTLPFALHALEAADAVGLRAWIAGAPACLLGPFAARLLFHEDDRRAYGDACSRCEASAVCPGVDPDYLERFGGDELTSTPYVAPLTRHAELQAMFVGAGELARAEGARVEPPPARARVGLPLLGKVKPAHAEVPASSTKRSGEELREIFPALFQERKDTPSR